MRYAALLFIVLIVSPVARAASWIALSTPNFQLYSTADETEARETLETFEQTRDFFLRVRVATPVSALPVTLVTFGTAKEYKPYEFRSFTPAYFISDEQRDYVVMSALADDRNRAAIHEYVHLVVRHSGLQLPVWFNEGIADVYSTMKVRDGKIIVGASPKDRTYSLTTGKWLRLPALVAVDTKSPEYTEGNRATVFYAQSWLLVHMLMLGEGYSDKFDAFVKRLSDSGSSQVAFSEVYGKSLAEVQTAMNTYFRGTSIGAAGYQATLRAAEIGPARPATDMETGLTLAKLSSLLGRFPEATTRLDALAAKHPDNYEIDEARAYLAWRSNALPEAARYFQAAIAHGTPEWKTPWDLARLLELGKRDRALQTEMLRAAILKSPNLGDARLLLARNLYDSGEPQQARAELTLVKNVTPELAPILASLLKITAPGVSTSPMPTEAEDVPNRPILRRTPAAPKPTKK